MPRRLRNRVRTWSGPVDLSSRKAECLLGGAWVSLGGREQLERLERREGRLLLRVEGTTGAFVTVSRQASPSRTAGSSERERAFGKELGHALLLMEVAGAGVRSTRMLGTAVATCGAADIGTAAVRNAAALIGGGANRWASDLSRALRADPHSVLCLEALVTRDGHPAGGVKPSSFTSALETAGALRAISGAVRSAGAEAPGYAHTPHLQSAPRPEHLLWNGWEAVLSPREGAEPELLRIAAQLGEVAVEARGGKEDVILRIGEMEHAAKSLSWLVRNSRHLLEDRDTDGLIRVGASGIGLRFRYCAEFGPLDPSYGTLVSDDGNGTEVGRALRREAENSGADLRTVARHAAALGEKVSALPVNTAHRIVRLATEGFDPKGQEWKTLMGVDA